MCDPTPTHAAFRTGVRQALHPKALYLASGRPRTIFPIEPRPAPQDELFAETDPLDISEAGRSAEEVAALILRRFYRLFGPGRESVPVLKDDGVRFDLRAL